MAKKQKKPLMADIKKNLDVVVLIVLLALSSIVVYLYMNEEKSGPPPIPPTPVGALDPVADISDHEGNVTRIFDTETTLIARTKDYKDLILYPLFEKVTSDKSQGLAKVADTRRRDNLNLSAQVLLAGSKFEDALSQVDEVLSDDATNTQAVALKTEIEAKMKEAAANPVD